MPQTYQQQPQQSAATAREYIFTITEPQMPESQDMHPAQQTQVVSRGQQQPRGPQNSYLVVDEQQPRTSRQQRTVHQSPSRCFNQHSVASVKGEESSHNISGLSSLFGKIQSVMNYQQMDTPQLFTPSDQHQHTASPPTTQQQDLPQQPAQPPAVI